MDWFICAIVQNICPWEFGQTTISLGLRPCEIVVYPNSLGHIFCTIAQINSPYLYNMYNQEESDILQKPNSNFWLAVSFWLCLSFLPNLLVHHMMHWYLTFSLNFLTALLHAVWCLCWSDISCAFLNHKTINW